MQYLPDRLSAQQAPTLYAVFFINQEEPCTVFQAQGSCRNTFDDHKRSSPMLLMSCHQPQKSTETSGRFDADHPDAHAFTSRQHESTKRPPLLAAILSAPPTPIPARTGKAAATLLSAGQRQRSAAGCHPVFVRAFAHGAPTPHTSFHPVSFSAYAQDAPMMTAIYNLSIYFASQIVYNRPMLMQSFLNMRRITIWFGIT